jgi:hypothetical protein
MRGHPVSPREPDSEVEQTSPLPARPPRETAQHPGLLADPARRAWAPAPPNGTADHWATRRRTPPNVATPPVNGAAATPPLAAPAVPGPYANGARPVDPAPVTAPTPVPAGVDVPARRGTRAFLQDHGALLTVLLVAAVGMLQVLTEHWRQGSALLGGALLVAAVLRGVLPPPRAGLLAIRGRVVDVVCYTAFGIAVLLLALTITRGSLAVG